MNFTNSYYTIPTNNTGFAWQPTAVANDNILNQNNITSNWKYRQYIQKNAKQIMQYNSMAAIGASGNNPYTIDNLNEVNKTPVYFNSIHAPTYSGTSDLKQAYLDKEQRTARMVAPNIPVTW